MSYQTLPLDEPESEERPPGYNHRDQASVTRTSGQVMMAPISSYPTGHHAANYVHINNGDDIIGAVFDIDTDKAAASGRFQSPEEQSSAPNVYLSADNIEAEIRLSGSKMVRIEIRGREENKYGRTMLRIVYPNNAKMPGARNRAPPFSLSVSTAWRASCIIAIPEQYTGSINGACTLAGRLREEAICLIDDLDKPRWTIQPAGPTNSEASQRGIAPECSHHTSASRQEVDETHTGSSSPEQTNSVEKSSISLTVLRSPQPRENPPQGQDGSTGRVQRQRRFVVATPDYKLSLNLLTQVETASHAFARKLAIIYVLSLLAFVSSVYYFARSAGQKRPLSFGLSLPVALPSVIVMVFWAAYNWSEISYTASSHMSSV